MNHTRYAGIAAGEAFLIAVTATAVPSAGAHSIDQSLAQAEARSQLTAANPGVAFYEERGRVARIYGPAFSHGDDAVDSANRFVQDHSQVFGLEPENLVAVGPFQDGHHVQPIMYDQLTDSYKFTGVYYTQAEGGIPVFRSRLTLLVRNDPGYPLVLAGVDLRDLGDFAIAQNAAPRVDIGKAQRAGGAQVGRNAQLTDPQVVIWAGVEDMVVRPRLAVQYTATTGSVANPGAYEKWLFVVDAETGAILFQEDQIRHDGEILGSVRGMATQGIGADNCEPEALVGLPYGEVKWFGDNDEVYTDVNGFFALPNPNCNAGTVQSRLWGLYFRVTNWGAQNSVLNGVAVPGHKLEFIHNADNEDEFYLAEVNTYLHSNIVRDFTLASNPDYPTIANQFFFTVNVNQDDTCNAFYDGISINFFRAGGGCFNTGNSTIVHHEYGHHVVATGGSGQGAYGEGMSDVMALLISDSHLLAPGFHGDCDVPLRNADNECQYQESGCSSCGDEIHACGRLLSGSVWSTRNELVVTEPDNYRQILADLAINAVLLHSGTSITPAITIDYLTLDDDDDDLTNGTPHYSEIAVGFSAHNMDGPEVGLLTFSFPDGLPDAILPQGGTTVRVDVASNNGNAAPGTGLLYVDIGDGFEPIAMDELEPNVYEAVFPASDCPTFVRYFFSAIAADGIEMFFPASGATEAFSAIAATAVKTVFEDNFEADAGWTATNTAIDGQWDRGIPVDCSRGDPPTDADGSGQCFLTDNSAGDGCDSDVDNGSVTLTSPVLDATGATLVSYWRWYSNAAGDGDMADIFVVDVSDDAGESWVNLETVGPDGPGVAGGWNQKHFAIDDFIEANDQFQIRFIASDLDDQSVIEAAVDGFSLLQLECAGANGDLDGDGVVGTSDLVILLGAWGLCGDCNDCPADLDDDCTVGSTDLIVLLGNWGG